MLSVPDQGGTARARCSTLPSFRPRGAHAILECRSRSVSPEVGPPPGDAAAHAPGSAALPHRATRLAHSPVLLTDAGTQILGTPSASSPTVAAKPFLKRRTSAVQSQRLDWSGVGPRTTTKLDPNLILDRTPGK